MKGGGFLRYWSEIMGKCCGTLGEEVFNVTRAVAFANFHYRIYTTFPQTLEKDKLVSSMIMFVKGGSQVFEKDIPRLLKRLGEG